MLELNKIYCGDCLKLMPLIDDKFIDLIIIDSPYNIDKAEWDKIKNYTEWIGKILKECERVLKNGGSFYFFHNDFLQIVEIQNWINNNSKFVFKQLIIWNKKFKGVNNEEYLQGFNEVEGLRNYQKMAEYCLFYIFPESFMTLKNYFKTEKQKVGWNCNQCDDYMGIRASYCYWNKNTNHEYVIPKERHYLKLQETGYWQIPYKKIKQKYERLRHTFNNQKTHHSVWNYEASGKQRHITPKPIELIKNIIKYSSNENDIILDPFMGSGTTAVACKQSSRNFIGIEINPDYVDIANKRLANTYRQMELIK